MIPADKILIVDTSSVPERFSARRLQIYASSRVEKFTERSYSSVSLHCNAIPLPVILIRTLTINLFPHHMCISLLVTSRRKAAAVAAFPTKGRMKAHYFCPQLGVIHPTASTPWAFSGRFKITAPFSWLHNAQESLLLEVLPCYPTNCCWGPNQLAVSVCKANFASAKGVDRWGRAGGREERNFATFMSFIWCHS